MPWVDREKCIGCEACVNVCPATAISMEDDRAKIDSNKCIDCGRCAQVCPQDAIHPGVKSQQAFPLKQGQMYPSPSFGMGRGMPVRPGGAGRGLGRGMGRGLRRGPRDGRGRGRGGGGRW
jgi:Fe-S-cluster-containing hydrogenase component 2